MPDQVGFIGLGIMGRPMARNLLKAGYQVVVYNRTLSRVQELVQEGAHEARSPGEVAERAPVVITMVTDTPDVQEVILGSKGVIEGVQRGSTVVDMSTISPAATREVAARLAEQGAALLDAPVSGGQRGAMDGTLAIMVGGDEAAFQRCLPILQALGRSIIHVGPSGTGQTAKLVNQILVAGTMNAVAEALVFAAKAGADLHKTLEVVSGGAAASWQLENLGPRVLRGDFAPGFMVKLQQKDLRLILEEARELKVPLPGTSFVHQMYASLEAEGRGEEGTQALVQVYERLAGVEVRAP